MVGAPSPREEEQARLTGARGEFVANLPRRLEALRAALAALEEEPTEGKRQHGMLRRIHALGAAARVLGFATVAEVLAEAERAVRRASRPGNQALAFQDIARALDLLPSLVLGGPAAPRPLGADAEARSAERAYPISVLLFGASTLADALRGDDPARLELERTEDIARARQIAQTVGPDVAVIDADRRDAKELVEQLLTDPQFERVPMLVIGAFVSPEAATSYVTLGAERVLPKPVSPETLRRTVFELHELASRPRTAREPVGELTIDGLADRITQEIRKGLVESAEIGGLSTPIDFADGTDVLAAVWGAVARVRELVTVRSKGGVRFQPFGPEGAIPLAPWTNDERRAGERAHRHGRGAEDVGLRGRRVLVADDDPAVVWFMTSLFKAVGAEVLEAHDGNRALELVFESSPDLVVSDVLMPGRDGFALCHEIKRDVIARDIPVILLSWKEDLLQRVRELGADADGYLRKEAAASTVVERVREVLRPRARVEQRLASGGESRGRLDGITPRFVLERVCKTNPDSTLTVRDAVYLYEVRVRGGRVCTATRTASDGSFERGERVLASLLGVSAGRFSVQPDHTPCRTEFQEPLEDLLRRHVERARAALAALSAERLGRVTRVEIDRASIGGYLECSPEWARKLIELLASGSPREILLSGEVAPRLLEGVLSDLSRRGAILAVEREDGAVDLSAPAVSASATAAPSAQVESHFQSAPMPAPGSSTQASPDGFSDASVEPPAVGTGALQPLTTGLGQSRALEGADDGARESDVQAGWFSAPVAEASPPPPATEALPPATEALPPMEVLPPATEVLPPATEVLPPATEVLPPTPLAPATMPLPPTPAPPAAGVVPGNPRPPDSLPATRPADELTESSAESMSFFAALTEGPAPVEAKSASPSEEPIPDIVPASDDLDFAVPHQTLGGLGPPLPVPPEVRAVEPARPLNQTLPFGSQEPLSGPRPALRIASETPAPGMAEAIVAAVADRTSRPGSDPAPSTPPTVEAPKDAEAPKDQAPKGVEPSADLLSAQTVVERAPFDAAEGEVEARSAAQTGSGPKASAPLEATLVSEGAPPKPAPVGEPVREVTAAKQASGPKSAASVSRPQSDARPEPPAEEGGGFWRTAVLALLAFAAAFALVRYALVPRLQPKESVESPATPQPEAPVRTGSPNP